jgi:hypothetical protein
VHGHGVGHQPPTPTTRRGRLEPDASGRSSGCGACRRPSPRVCRPPSLGAKARCPPRRQPRRAAFCTVATPLWIATVRRLVVRFLCCRHAELDHGRSDLGAVGRSSPGELVVRPLPENSALPCGHIARQRHKIARQRHCRASTHGNTGTTKLGSATHTLPCVSPKWLGKELCRACVALPCVHERCRAVVHCRASRHVAVRETSAVRRPLCRARARCRALNLCRAGDVAVR